MCPAWCVSRCDGRPPAGAHKRLRTAATLSGVGRHTLPTAHALQAELDGARQERQRLQQRTAEAEAAAAAADASVQAARKERDQTLKQNKAEASRRERDMLASHTSEVAPSREPTAPG